MRPAVPFRLGGPSTRIPFRVATLCHTFDRCCATGGRRTGQSPLLMSWASWKGCERKLVCLEIPQARAFQLRCSRCQHTLTPTPGCSAEMLGLALTCHRHAFPGTSNIVPGRGVYLLCSSPLGAGQWPGNLVVQYLVDEALESRSLHFLGEPKEPVWPVSKRKPKGFFFMDVVLRDSRVGLCRGTLLPR